MSVMRDDVSAQSVVKEISTFLVATASALRETVTLFERTTTRITEHVMARRNTADRDLIVTLQGFDRMQQEFATIADVLTRAAEKSSESWQRMDGDGHPAQDVMAPIVVADLKERLVRRLDTAAMDFAGVPEEAEAVF